MIGVDIGFRIASATAIDINGKYIEGKAIKTYSQSTEFNRTVRAAKKIVKEVITLENLYGLPAIVSIEEPVYSWGRRNPKGFAKLVGLFIILKYMLVKNGYKVVDVNNKTAKKVAGSGSKKKDAMVKAFKKRTGVDFNTKYERETVADSYFIALAGLKGQS